MTEQQAHDAPADQNSANSTDNNAPERTEAQDSGNTLLSAVSENHADLVKAKGWKTPDDVITSYANMEKFAGKFSSRGVVIPDGDDAEEWGKVYSKLGRPEAPNGYEFSHIDPKSLNDESKEVLNTVKEIGFKYGLSKKQLEGFVGEYDAKMSDIQKSQHEAMTRKVNAQVNELKTEWGSAWDKNVALAKTAAQKFGIEGDTLKSLEENVGFMPLMKTLAEMGEFLQEDGFVQGSGSSSTGVKTPKQALQELKEVQADPDYLDNKKNPNRHKMLREKARDLYQMVYPDRTE